MSMGNSRYCADLVICAWYKCKRKDAHEGAVTVVVLAGLRLPGLKGFTSRYARIKYFTVGGIVAV